MVCTIHAGIPYQGLGHMCREELDWPLHMQSAISPERIKRRMHPLSVGCEIVDKIHKNIKTMAFTVCKIGCFI